MTKKKKVAGECYELEEGGADYCKGCVALGPLKAALANDGLYDGSLCDKLGSDCMVLGGIWKKCKGKCK